MAAPRARALSSVMATVCAELGALRGSAISDEDKAAAKEAPAAAAAAAPAQGGAAAE